MPKTRQSKVTAKSKKPLRNGKPDAISGIPSIHASMNVMEIIALHPGAAEILGAYGLHCFHCAWNTLDSLEAGAKTHGLSDVDIENIVSDLEELLRTEPPRPKELTLTESGAKALLEIAKAEGKETCMLRVGSDDAGGFCMEFAEMKTSEDREFTNATVKGVALIASPEALFRVGGATVDYREGRFKLDVPKSASCRCRSENGACACEKH